MAFEKSTVACGIRCLHFQCGMWVHSACCLFVFTLPVVCVPASPCTVFAYVSVIRSSAQLSHTFFSPSHTLIHCILFQEDELDENQNLESLQSPPHHMFTLHFVSQ